MTLSTPMLVTELRGTVTVAAVRAWQQSLQEQVNALPEGTHFKLLFDLCGYEPATLDAHKAMRNVVPALLAAHGLRPAVADLFDPPLELPVVVTRGVRCIAYANVHHDAGKMAEYDRRIGRANQRFFADRATAERWLAEVE